MAHLASYCHRSNSCLYVAVSLSRPEPPYIKTPGVLLTVGQGDVGQLGLGPNIMERSRPTLVPEMNNIIDICAGGMHTVCFTESGEVRPMLFA